MKKIRFNFLILLVFLGFFNLLGIDQVIAVNELKVSIRVPQDYPTIQEAIDAAEDGDTILVWPGEYDNFEVRNKSLTIKSRFGPQYTKIKLSNGQIMGVVASFMLSEGHESTLEGFTIHQGNSWNAGGIYCLHSSPTIKNNIITENYVFDGGGAGIHIDAESAPLIINNMIVSNSGAGIDINALGAGGNTKMPQIINNIIADNHIYYQWDGGAGIFIAGDSAGAVIKNNIVVNNQNHSGYGGGIYVEDSQFSEVSLSYNDVWGNWAYSGGNNYYGISSGKGDISEDPLFVDYAAQDFHLQSLSPCINSGDPHPEFNDEDGSRNDMGSYGGPQGYLNIVVYVPLDYPTIQEAIDFALPDMKVYVAGGRTYNERIRMKDGVDLEGETPTTTIIDGNIPGVYYYAHSTITGANDCLLKGFKIIGASSGLSNDRAPQNQDNNQRIMGGNKNLKRSLDATFSKTDWPDTAPYAGISCFEVNNMKVQNNIISNNNAMGISVVSSSVELINNTIANNENIGVYVGNAASDKEAILRNNIIVENRIGIQDAGLQQTAVSTYNDVWGNLELNYDGVTNGQGDISQEPQFMSQEDYHLLYISPCIDAGDPGDDYSQEPEPNGERINQGSYGNTPEATTSVQDTKESNSN